MGFFPALACLSARSGSYFLTQLCRPVCSQKLWHRAESCPISLCVSCQGEGLWVVSPSLPGTPRTSASWRSSVCSRRAGCASRQPHSSSGRARSSRLTPATISASCGALVVSCAQLQGTPACRSRSADPPGPGALQRLTPTPPEVVSHPLCLSTDPRPSYQGRRGVGELGAAPPTSPAAR